MIHGLRRLTSILPLYKKLTGNMASHQNPVYTDLVEDDYEDYFSELAGDTPVSYKCARNKRSTTTCYSSKHVRVSQMSKTLGNTSRKTSNK